MLNSQEVITTVVMRNVDPALLSILPEGFSGKKYFESIKIYDSCRLLVEDFMLKEARELSAASGLPYQVLKCALLLSLIELCTI